MIVVIELEEIGQEKGPLIKKVILEIYQGL
jgi:hypothetical protein